jgi:DNA-binding NtrC family response regulator
VPSGFWVSGVSAPMRPIQRLLAEIAPTEIPVLLLGESGVGKEIAAMQIHSLSHRRNFAFVKLASSSLTPESLESHFQLRTNRPVDGEDRSGTLFFDEIGDLDKDCQRRLLNSIPDGAGVLGTQPTVGRIVSCSTRDLETDVHHGNFRNDLFYRLSGVCIQLPPLRQRREDIPILVQHFLAKYARVFHRPEMSLSDRVLQLLMEHPWPGNIRQLENVVKRIVALENEELGIVDLKISPMMPGLPSKRVTSSRSLKDAARAASRQAERELILQTLEKTHWNRKRAAEALQISYKSLLFKLKQIQVPGAEEV